MICFCWAGFPQYAARLVGAFVESTKERVVVLANRPAVPVAGMEEHVHCELTWIQKGEARSLGDILGEWPSHFFVNGWFTPVFNRFRDEARRHGGKVFAMVDNSFTGTVKDYLRAIRFRFLFRSKFDGYFVPGQNGVKMMRKYGVSASRVQTGMYSADDRLFADTVPVLQRPKKVIFVGRFVALKNLELVCSAFLSAKGPEKGWCLELRGCGPMRERIPEHPQIQVCDFVQPEELPAVYMGARAFVLGSHYDHWGLVVHEAALSGCALLLSDQVGAADDFLREGINGFSFSPWKLAQIEKAFEKLFLLTDEQWELSEKTSVALAHENAGRKRFVKGIEKLIKGA